MRFLGLLLVLFVGAASAASTPVTWPDDATLRRNLTIRPDIKLFFRDREGKSIDEATFLAGANSGSEIGFKADEGNGFLVLNLVDPPTKPRFELSNLAIGEPMPAFKLPAMDGRMVDSKALPDDLTVVDFFFVDCTGCIAEVPGLNAFHAAHPETGTLAITYDARSEVEIFHKKHHLTWRTVPDAVVFFNAINMQGFPTLGIVDRNGKLLALELGWKLHPPGKDLTGDDVAKWVADVRASRAAAR